MDETNSTPTPENGPMIKPRRDNRKLWTWVLIGLLFLASVAGTWWWQQRTINALRNNVDQPETHTDDGGTTSSAETDSETANWSLYSDPSGLYKIKYPGDWQLVRCRNNNSVFFGSSPANVGFQGEEDDLPIVCGGGSDFPPQVSIQTVPELDSSDGGTQITIDGVSATKERIVSDGSGLFSEGFITLSYRMVVNGKNLVITYHQWPESHDSYDIDPKNEKVFETMVENTLELSN